MTDNFPTFKRIGRAIKRMIKKAPKRIAVLLIFFLIVHSILWVVWSRQLNSDIDALRRRGEPVTIAELAQKPIPESENAAVVYEKAFKQLKDDKYIDEFVRSVTDGEPNTHNRTSTPTGPPPTPVATAEPTVSGTNEKPVIHNSPESASADHVEEDTPARREKRARRVIAQQSQLFALIEEAQSRPQCRFNINYKDEPLMWFAHLSPLRNLCRLYQAKAIIDAKDGHLDAAVTDIIRAIKITRCVQEEPVPISYEWRIWSTQAALRTLQALSKDQSLTAAQSRLIYDAVADPKLEQNLNVALVGGRVPDMDYFEQARKHPNRVLWMLMEIELPGEVAPKIFGYIWKPLSYKDEQAYIRYIDFLSKSTNLPYREFARKYPDGAIGQVPNYAFLTKEMCPVFAYIWAKKDATKAEIGISQTAMALKAYKNRLGAYPTSIAELRQKLGWKIPEDPFTGKDFIYARRGNGFILYSFGRNLKDDHGRTPKEARGSHGYDIVWKSEK